MKKGFYYEDIHLKIRNDALYVSPEFVKLLESKRKSLVPKIIYSDHTVRYNIHGIPDLGCMNLFFYKVTYSDGVIKYRLCGRSGDFGFGVTWFSKKFTLGLWAQRRAIKYIYDLYKNIYEKELLGRKYKLKRIINGN